MLPTGVRGDVRVIHEDLRTDYLHRLQEGNRGVVLRRLLPDMSFPAALAMAKRTWGEHPLSVVFPNAGRDPNGVQRPDFFLLVPVMNGKKYLSLGLPRRSRLESIPVPDLSLHELILHPHPANSLRMFHMVDGIFTFYIGKFTDLVWSSH